MRSEVRGNAGHVAAAYDLDTRLLQRLESISAFTLCRDSSSVDRVVMVPQPHGETVGDSPKARRLDGRKSPRRQRQAGSLSSET